jgi:hypothetical protein
VYTTNFTFSGSDLLKQVLEICMASTKGGLHPRHQISIELGCLVNTVKTNLQSRHVFHNMQKKLKLSFSRFESGINAHVLQSDNYIYGAQGHACEDQHPPTKANAQQTAIIIIIKGSPAAC